MRSYKKWSKEDRLKSLRLTNKAKRLGLLTPATSCNRCGQSEGIIHWHNEDYDITLSVLGKAFDVEKRKYLTDDEVSECGKALETLCWRCHMMHHSFFKGKDTAKKYFEEISNGKVYPPVLRRNFDVSKKDHSVS